MSKVVMVMLPSPGGFNILLKATVLNNLFFREIQTIVNSNNYFGTGNGLESYLPSSLWSTFQ